MTALLLLIWLLAFWPSYAVVDAISCYRRTKIEGLPPYSEKSHASEQGFFLLIYILGAVFFAAR